MLDIEWPLRVSLRFPRREAGKALRYHEGLVRQEDGSLLTKPVILGVCKARNGGVCIMTLRPYTE